MPPPTLAKPSLGPDEATARAIHRSSRGQHAFAANLIRLRKAAGLTQMELAAKSGVSQSNISALELTTWEPKLSTILALAEALEVPPADLLIGWNDR
ncbi:helix-turn-helix domain-containing protein [Paracraurococcus lichenis]|uniref:Helix-turn-helix transcriptional regulator n=1 Tax=Paracraurococcus lichenis TaxID=3064888 RepID=A0ABT9E8N1_9PROT|nr:helix-turn-helix transcriptional regulator [Paracraurococcus sp. LOR1-02]MDO9712540.1 helix-turn-helix transcriptional regulator [Paracraurococcus sp. LOR1-02]